ncbi:hypothetical protein [Paraburkholderia kururiensis]|jgi:hypothetical protein|nr:hypothetical protein [Paraburkholderia kururiensis]
MKKSKFTDSQIMEALKRAEAGVAVAGHNRSLRHAVQMGDNLAIGAF